MSFPGAGGLKVQIPPTLPKEDVVSTTASRISQISLVTIPVEDQDASIAFYESIGFEKRTDIPFGDQYRWVEVYPPNGTTGIALAPPPPGKDAAPRETGITLTTDDIEATHDNLKSLGVDADDVMRMGGPVPPMFWFRDNGGHTLLVVESQS
jgi:catechol 2,3-dioxygenase-like lactoylglutathione lyase family enzyme